MKNYLILIFTLFLLCSGVHLHAQSENTVSLVNYELEEESETVRIVLKTEESFIVGANRYVLHIGGKHFLRNEHPDGRLDEIIFLVPQSEFNTLEENKEIVLVYGLYHENTLQDGEGSQMNGFTGKHWRLGQFERPIFSTK